MRVIGAATIAAGPFALLLAALGLISLGWGLGLLAAFMIVGCLIVMADSL